MDTLFELESPADGPGKEVEAPSVQTKPPGLGAAGGDGDDRPGFDWFTDDSVLLGEQLATALYRNRADAIVIRQEGVGGDDDHFVVLRDAEAVFLLIGALQRAAKGDG